MLNHCKPCIAWQHLCFVLFCVCVGKLSGMWQHVGKWLCTSLSKWIQSSNTSESHLLFLFVQPRTDNDPLFSFGNTSPRVYRRWTSSSPLTSSGPPLSSSHTPALPNIAGPVKVFKKSTVNVKGCLKDRGWTLNRAPAESSVWSGFSGLCWVLEQRRWVWGQRVAGTKKWNNQLITDQ